MFLGVINDILDFSKIEAGKLHIESVETSLQKVIDAVLDVVSEKASEESLGLRVVKQADMPDTVLSDPVRIQQVLLNLLTNAIKFTEAGIITLELGKQNEHLVFRVTDSGILDV